MHFYQILNYLIRSAAIEKQVREVLTTEKEKYVFGQHDIQDGIHILRKL